MPRKIRICCTTLPIQMQIDVVMEVLKYRYWDLFILACKIAKVHFKRYIHSTNYTNFLTFCPISVHKSLSEILNMKITITRKSGNILLAY